MKPYWQGVFPAITTQMHKDGSLDLDATATQPQAAFDRQAHSREWTFTPEVCLGPAFRSLAPPFVG